MPADSLLSSVLAWARRQLNPSVPAGTPKPATSVVVGSAPTASPTQLAPDQTTGVVTGSINGTSAAGTTVRYQLSGVAPTSGSVVVDATTGTYTYTPSSVGRTLAGLKTTATVDTFTVSVSNNEASTQATVNVPVLPTAIVTSISTTAVGANPIGIAVTGTKVYVANSGGSTLSVIDRNTGVVVNIPVTSGPTSVAVSPDGSRAYVGGNGAVSVVNLDTNTVTATVKTNGGSVYGITVAATGQLVYVSNSGNNSISVIDTSTSTPTVITTISVGKSPRAVALSADGSRLYVANWSSKSISVIDTTTNKTVGSQISVGSNPFGVAVSQDGSRVYVSNNGSNSVSVIDAVAAKSVATISVGSQPLGITLSPDGSMLYVANGPDTVSAINTNTNTVVKTITVDSTPETNWHDIAFSPDGSQIYVSDKADNVVRVLNVVNPPVAGIPTIGTPDPANGAVTGNLNFTNPNRDPLTYTVTAPSTGTVTVTSTGEFTFTPTQAARNAAAQTTVTTSTTFTVTASAGALSTTISVEVPILPSTTAAPTVPYLNAASWLWNVVQSGAVLGSNSAAWTAMISGGQHVFDINAYGVTVVDASSITANTPRYTIKFTNSPAWGPSPFGTYTVPIPLGTVVPSGSDGHLVIVDPTTNQVFGLWQAKYNAKTDTWSASWGGMTSLSGNGIDTTGSATATGFSRLAGIVRADEFSTAVAGNTGLNHALFFSSSFAADSFVYPAVKSDAMAPNPLIPMGTRFILDPSINVDAIPGITPGEKVIAKTLQTYGGYIADAGSAPLALIGELSPGNTPYTAAGIGWDYYDMSKIPWKSLQFLASWNGAGPT
ncbi:hypothetical protein BOO86_04740 [Mycobacterium sp. CBMA 234]|uniref:YncE family protein n=1 Tax=Mycolicibacterium sp. CBMA 234 TaxID=1918495 RepID=UPI001390F3C5|nr:YncE family protein [Mycolicibacterium sp. CBMA 234]MUL63763.1 hypothetical protein [Mycolicibacterium sp. CBMA 234]